jgi:type IV fimbrial biogenesis protein FimT
MKPRAGHTLIEMLVVLVLAGILLSAAMPGYQSLLQRQQLRTAVNDMLAAIDLTRSQAIARGSRVLLAPLDPAGVAWRQGWIVFADDNGNRRPDPGEPVFYRHGAVAAGIAISSAFSSGAAPLYLAYNAAGRSCSASNSLAAHWGTISFRQGAQARNMKINMLGRVRVCDPALESDNCSGAAD